MSDFDSPSFSSLTHKYNQQYFFISKIYFKLKLLDSNSLIEIVF